MSPGRAVYGCPVSLIVCIINPEVGVCTLGQLDEIQITTEPLYLYMACRWTWDTGLFSGKEVSFQ